jgi:hypothetical protein
LSGPGWIYDERRQKVPPRELAEVWLFSGKQTFSTATPVINCYSAAIMAREKETVTKRIGLVALLVLLLPMIILFGPVVLVLYWLHRMVLYCFIWLLWLPKGKDVLLVHSDSPIWHDYMTTQVVPLVQNRAVILNWSERHEWSKWSFPVHVFRSFAGRKEFNPMVAVFRQNVSVLVSFQSLEARRHRTVSRLREDLLQSL